MDCDARAQNKYSGSIFSPLFQRRPAAATALWVVVFVEGVVAYVAAIYAGLELDEDLDDAGGVQSGLRPSWNSAMNGATGGRLWHP